MREENMKFVSEKMIPPTLPSLRQRIQNWVKARKDGATSREVNAHFSHLQPRTVRDHLYNSVCEGKLKTIQCRCNHSAIYFGV